jgi:hypothetical protein
VNEHLYLYHLLVLSSPALMMHGHTNLKFPEELCVPLIEVTDKMLAHSHTGECVFAVLQVTQIQHVCVLLRHKDYKWKMEHFISTLL